MRKGGATEALIELAESYKGKSAKDEKEAEEWRGWAVERRLDFETHAPGVAEADATADGFPATRGRVA